MTQGLIAGLLAGIAAAGISWPAAAAPTPAADDPADAAATGQASTAAADTGMALAGDKEGTVFGSMTVEGENRIQIEFERPELEVDIDPHQAPGLEWGSVMDVLDRSRPDLVSPLVALTAGETSPYLPRPWLELYRTGPVARFRPAVREVDSWRLVVVDSRGEEVAAFADDDDPPEEISWDGRTASGELAQPGLTYSYVFEARDRAGNRRRFVGDGFQVPAYRTGSGASSALMVSGSQLQAADGNRSLRGRSASSDQPNPYILEAASRLSLACGPAEPLVIQVTARSFEEGNSLGERIERQLRTLLPGDPARLSVQVSVQPGAPEGGTVLIAAGRQS